MPAHLHHHRHFLHPDAFLYKLCLCIASLFSHKEADQDHACSLSTRREGFPALFNVSPIRPLSYNMLLSQSISTPPQLSSTCCVIVATRDGDWEGLDGLPALGITGERGISLVGPAIRHWSCSCTCCTELYGRTVSKHSICARTHSRSAHQTSLIPQPTEAGHMLCTKNSMRLPVLLLHIAGFDVALVRHSIFITYAP